MLEGSLRDRALTAAGELATALVAVVDATSDPHPALASTAGLVMHYLAVSVGRDDANATVQRLLERAADGIAEHPLTSALHGGLSGIGWVLAHVQEHAGARFGADGDDPVDAIDAALLEALEAHEVWRGDIDLINGLVGIGVYALQRRHRPRGRHMVERIVAHLACAARTTDRGMAIWRPREHLGPSGLDVFPGGCFDLGMAHGSAGVIAWLADVDLAGLASTAASQLLDGSVAWLLSQLAESGVGSLCPAQVDADDRRLPSRLAWCYGDPGVAMALYKAGWARRNPAWQARALRLARRAVEIPRDQTGVVNAFLCHGYLGNAHLYNRLWQATEQGELAAAACDWYAQALDRAASHGGLAAHWDPQAAPEAAIEGTPLGGTAGVALALLAGATAIEPRWDDLLLLGSGASNHED